MGQAGEVIPADLIGLAQQGDHHAIDALLRLAQRDIRRYARRSCRSPDIDDAVQETLTTVARRIAMLRSPVAFAAWVFVIVRRECLRLAGHFPFGGPDLDSIHNSLDLAIRPEADLRFDIASAIQSLPEHYRVILLLRDVEERSIADIAAQLGLTREATKARLRRARLMVREYLAD